MGITFSPECGSNFECEPEYTERRRVRDPGRPRKDRTEDTPLKSRVHTRLQRFEDFDKEE
jgi:hypothetical protein